MLSQSGETLFEQPLSAKITTPQELWCFFSNLSLNLSTPSFYSRFHELFERRSAFVSFQKKPRPPLPHQMRSHVWTLVSDVEILELFVHGGYTRIPKILFRLRKPTKNTIYTRSGFLIAFVNKSIHLFFSLFLASFTRNRFFFQVERVHSENISTLWLPKRGGTQRQMSGSGWTFCLEGGGMVKWVPTNCQLLGIICDFRLLYYMKLPILVWKKYRL